MEFRSTGKVKQIRDGIVIADGLSGAGYNEFVIVKDTKGREIPGLALNIEKDNVGIVVLGNSQSIRQNDLVYSTGKGLSIQVGKEIMGNVIDALGNSLEGKEFDFKTSMFLEKIAPGVAERQDVYRPLPTGIKAIDSMIPVGKGQRELIIGDRQTGKTAIGIDTIINQKGKNVFCIYVGIGQKSSKIAQIRAKLDAKGAMDYTVIVAANASDPAAMQYLAPYTGTAIGEFFAQDGKDALIVYDDLTKHAWAYREISLLLGRPPGREAYPGDVFYLHSRLLERSVQYSEDQKGGSLTALPVIETQAGDISAYIPTNVISITDGQIYLESDLFNAGQRPAVNIGLSVSRVGGSAQVKAMKQVAGDLRLDLAQYRELAAFAQFGSDLDEETQNKLDRGKRMYELLKQPQYDPIRTGVQVMTLYAGVNGYLDNIEVEDVLKFEAKLSSLLETKYEKLLEQIESGTKIEGKVEEEIKKILEEIRQ